MGVSMESVMAKSKRILVAVDGSPASRQTVKYVADIVGGGADFHVGLIHLELPPRMLEWGGAEDAKIEDRKSSERADAYQVMEKKAVAGGQALLQMLEKILAERDIDVAAKVVRFEEPLDPKTIVRNVLEAAREGDYGTLVVGRNSFSWLRRVFGHHIGEELVRTGQGFVIWVVE
jgi:nucleotide-binding universal stress UspA family protein